MSSRKDIFKRIISRKDKISESPNITKRQADAETEEQNIRQQLDGQVPEEFKNEMEKRSKEDLITDLFFTKYELLQAKRDLELTTFKLTQMQKESSKREEEELDITDLDLPSI